MDITIVDNPKDREEIKRVLDGHADMINGDISKEAWNDTDRFPRKQWLMVEDETWHDEYKFTVVDNRSGECYEEGFETLDGALLYLCDCHLTCEHQEVWDHCGAVMEHGGFNKKEGEE